MPQWLAVGVLVGLFAVAYGAARTAAAGSSGGRISRLQAVSIGVLAAGVLLVTGLAEPYPSAALAAFLFALAGLAFVLRQARRGPRR